MGQSPPPCCPPADWDEDVELLGAVVLEVRPPAVVDDVPVPPLEAVELVLVEAVGPVPPGSRRSSNWRSLPRYPQPALSTRAGTLTSKAASKANAGLSVGH